MDPALNELGSSILQFRTEMIKLLRNFAWVCANDAHVCVAVTGVCTVGVGSSVSTGLELPSTL
jgi:hypothetical protein